MLNKEQILAYKRFILARDKVKLVKTKKNRGNPYIPHRTYIDNIVIVGMNHPMFVLNDAWVEYLEASLLWWAVEPEFRHKERMRASRGDYGTEDNWDDPEGEIESIDQYFKEN